MTSFSTASHSRPRRPIHVIATGVALAALAVPGAASAASAADHKVDGVRAEVKGGALEVKGGDQDNAVALRLKAGDPNRVQVDVGDDGSADFSFARRDLSGIRVQMGDGADSVRIDDANGAVTGSIPTTIAGGGGDDTLNGGQGAESYRGGDGNDTVDGNGGSDTADLGGGSDIFRWDPGDGSDTIEGQDGSDTMLFNGGAGGETVTMTANGGRLTFFRVQGNITMDTDDVETVDFNALGGPDNVTVNDLTGTDVTQTNLDLAAAPGGNAADGAVDNVVVNATNGDDAISIDGNGSGADVTGLATAVSVTHADPTDSLSVNTLAGTDDVLVNGVAGVLQVLVDGTPA